MKIFKGLFNTNENGQGSNVPWQNLIEAITLETIRLNSKTKPQAVFKHSTSCGISNMVLQRFNTAYNLNQGQMDFYLLDLLAYREISNTIAQTFGVIHQSPQLIIVKNGVAVHSESHSDILQVNLTQFL